MGRNSNRNSSRQNRTSSQNLRINLFDGIDENTNLKDDIETFSNNLYKAIKKKVGTKVIIICIIFLVVVGTLETANSVVSFVSDTKDMKNEKIEEQIEYKEINTKLTVCLQENERLTETSKEDKDLYRKQLIFYDKIFQQKDNIIKKERWGNSYSQRFNKSKNNWRIAKKKGYRFNL